MRKPSFDGKRRRENLEMCPTLFFWMTLMKCFQVALRVNKKLRRRRGRRVRRGNLKEVVSRKERSKQKFHKESKLKV